MAEDVDAALRRHAALAPDLGTAWQDLAGAAERRSDLVEAIAFAGRAIAGSVAPDPWRLRARLLEAAGRPLDGLMSRTRAWQLAHDAGTYQELWYGFRALGQRNDPGLFEAFRGTSLAYPALIGKGNALRSADMAAEAEAPYREAMALRPDLPFAYSRLGCLLVRLGGPLEADELFATAAHLAPWIEEAIEFGTDLEGASMDESPKEPTYLASPVGDRTSAPFVVLVSCDSRYFQQYGYVLANSMRQACRPPPALHVHLIDPASADHALVERLRRDFDDLDLFVTTESLGDGDTGRRRSVSCCARFLLLPHLLRRHRRKILVCDIDIVVLRDLNELTRSLSGADVGVIRRTAADLDFWDEYSAALFWVAPTEEGRGFAGKVKAYIERQFERGRHWWYLDQIALYAVLAVPTRPPRVELLPVETMAIEHFDASAPGASAPPPAAYVWSVTSSLGINRGKLETELFRRYQATDA